MSIYSPVTVLSYNICFQAMTHNATGSAWELGNKCTYIGHSKLTICANHMAEAIDAIPASLNVASFDFVGLQEASRWYLLQQNATETLNKMQVVGSKEGRSEMATFYNGTRYRLDNHYFGSFDTDRPFQILLFKNLFDTSGTIFINAHNPHGYSFDGMQGILSTAIKAMDLASAEKQYRIIAVGDFNETGWDWNTGKMKQKTWTPFYDNGVKIKTSISIDEAVYSCCQANGDWSDSNGGIAKGSRGGDYIFDSKNAAKIIIPSAYNPKVLQSDHLPVVALLT